MQSRYVGQSTPATKPEWWTIEESLSLMPSTNYRIPVAGLVGEGQCLCIEQRYEGTATWVVRYPGYDDDPLPNSFRLSEGFNLVRFDNPKSEEFELQNTQAFLLYCNLWRYIGPPVKEV